MYSRKILIIPLIVAATLALSIAVVTAPNTYTIDVKPFSCPSSVNPCSRGTTPVGIIGITDVDPSTVEFFGVPVKQKPNGDYMGNVGDADGVGGDNDYIVHFSTEALLAAGFFDTVTDACANSHLGLDPGILVGETTGGTPFSSTGGAINLVGRFCRNGFGC